MPSNLNFQSIDKSTAKILCITGSANTRIIDAREITMYQVFVVQESANEQINSLLSKTNLYLLNLSHVCSTFTLNGKEKCHSLLEIFFLFPISFFPPCLICDVSFLCLKFKMHSVSISNPRNSLVKLQLYT